MKTMSKTFSVVCWLDCEWAFRRSYTDEEILHIIWVNMSDDLFGEIIDEISEVIGREVDDIEFDEEKLIKCGKNHITSFESEEGEYDKECVAIRIYFCLDLSDFVGEN